MDISLDKPELETFIREKVESGQYRSAKEVVEAGLARLMLDPLEEDLTAEDIVEIEQSEREYARGEGLDWDAVKIELRAKYLKH